MRTLTSSLALFMFCSALNAGDPLYPLKVTAPPVIDGELNDEVWTRAPKVTDFMTFIPDFSKKQEQKTIVGMAYDRENLYFAFWCYDEPDKIKTSMSARDAIRPDDWVCINLDSFGDQQGLYAFYINPNGIQTDSRFAGGNEDFSADLVWYSAGKMTSDGYQVEIQLPLKSLRYADGDSIRMTVFFERYVSRLSEHGSYPALDPKFGYAFLPQMAPMIYSDLEHFTLFEALPAVVYNQQKRHTGGKLVVADERGEGSLTFKYGITSDLTLDATYNPDFSQVEADAGQVDVNLRFNLFFPEKRPFFLEGREYFAMGGAGNASTVDELVHTRTIVDPRVGLKLTGKVGDRNIVSALYANDELLNAPPGSPSKANFFITRYRRNLSDDSFLGGVFTSRESGSGYNRVGGVDGKLRVGEGSQAEYHLVGSMHRNDGSPTTMNGYSGSAAWNTGTRDVDYGIAAADISENFQSDVGFITRTGVTSASAYYRPKFYLESGFVNRIVVGLSTFNSHDKFSSLWETSSTVLFNVLHRDNLTFNSQLTYSTEVFLGRRFNTSNVYAQWGGQLIRWLAFSTNYRYGNGILYSIDPVGGTTQRFSATTTIQPSENLAFVHTLTYADFQSSSGTAGNYSYPINRVRLSYQVNRYLFVRSIAEYNGFRKRLPTDFLISFTYIPGTVLHAGYGMIYNRLEYDPVNFEYIPSQTLLQTNAGLFFKASYLWRM